MSKESYKDYRERVTSKQSGMSYADIKAQMAKRSEHMVELDNLEPQTHLWTDRGLKQTCENAGHPYHEAFKIRKKVL